MKKLMMIALAACAAVITGCRAVTVENYGEEIARDAESKPVTLADGLTVDPRSALIVEFKRGAQTID